MIKSFKDFISEDAHTDALMKMYKTQQERKEKDIPSRAARAAEMDRLDKENLEKASKLKLTPAEIERHNKNHLATADDNRKRGWSND